MPVSECTRSIRAVSDTPVTNYYVPGFNSIRRVPFHPLMPVSSFHLILWVYYFEWSLLRCGHLWPYVTMDSVGTHFHRDCNALGDIAKWFSLIPSTCLPNVILSILFKRDWKAMGDAAKISARIPPTSAQHSHLPIVIIHIIRSHQINVARAIPLLIPSVSYLATSSYMLDDVHAAYNISHVENFQYNTWRSFSHFYKFRDWIQVT